MCSRLHGWVKCALLCIAVTFSMGSARSRAQLCPPGDGRTVDAPKPATLHGRLVFHDNTRGWLGLKLEHPVCGQREIEIAFSSQHGWRYARSLAGCEVSAEGKLSESVTAYYSTSLNLFDPKLQPGADCHPDTALSYPDVVIPAKVSHYRVTVWIDVKDQKPLRGEIVDLQRHVALPGSWRYYAQVSMNGEEDLDLSCHDGFGLISFRSRPGSASSLFTPGTARLHSGELGPSWLSIECKRAGSAASASSHVPH